MNTQQIRTTSPLSAKRGRFPIKSLIALAGLSAVAGSLTHVLAGKTNPPDVTCIYLDYTTSVGARPFEAMKQAAASVLPFLVGKRVCIRKFGADVRPIWEGILTVSELPRVQALTRSALQESDPGTSITGAAMDAAAYAAAQPGAKKLVLLETDGLEDVRTPYREIPTSFKSFFPGVTMQFLFLRDRLPRAADLAAAAGARVTRFAPEESPAALTSEALGVHAWQRALMPVSWLLLGTVPLTLGRAWAVRPRRPAPLVWVGITLPNGEAHGTQVRAGETLVAATTADADIRLPQDWPATRLSLCATALDILTVTNEGARPISLAGAARQGVPSGQSVQTGDGERLLLSSAHAVRLIIRDHEPAFGGGAASGPSTPPASGGADTLFTLR